MLFWVAGLLLALIDIPDFGWPLRRIAGSLEKIADIPPGKGADAEPDETVTDHAPAEGTAEVPKIVTLSRMPKERTDA